MKKAIAVLLTAMLALGTTACSGGAASSQSASGASSEGSSAADASSAGSSSASAAETGEKSFKVGIIQLVEHPALDATYKGFVDGLKEAGYEEGKNLVIDYENAQNEQANCQTIASKLVNDRSDLIFAIATPAAQAVATATKDIPILVSAVTDPADAKLVASNEKPGGNVTGTSDLTPVAEQIKLVKEILPDAKKIGLLYCSNEMNSKFQIEIAKKAAAENGLETVEATVSNSNEIQQVVQSLVGKVDAIYSPTDNMIANGMPTVSMVTTPAKLPVIVGEGGMVDGGGLATYGIDYYSLGLLTAKQAVKILEGTAKPADMPIEYSQECTLRINTEAAEKMGLAIPQALLDKVKAE